MRHHNTCDQKPWDMQRRDKAGTIVDWQRATTNRLARAQAQGDALVAAMIVVDTRADRHLADRAADVSLRAWLKRTRGATLPAWAVGIDAVDLVRLPRPDPDDDGICGSARLVLLWAQWGDADAAQRLCNMAQDMCSTDTCHGRLAPLSLRKDIALWHPIVAHANNIQVRLFVPVLAEIAAAGTADDGPTCIACMCEPPPWSSNRAATFACALATASVSSMVRGGRLNAPFVALRLRLPGACARSLRQRKNPSSPNRLLNPMDRQTLALTSITPTPVL
ncbi:Ring u-box domain-containing protein [Pandoravirus inopinatum]|uniref:Ring u-box domain-containing protein n=1 Tax=Pandoravirus inopinatum TaxID=1605721 RepID=A0A0B5IXG1_9VIRU|nr:Ring u-box domain-containing protein [Pandoravirus inopinatum]AJF97448.1 Ring u-box domain-containing protein [Pandoravirus inopinatum]